MFDIGWSEMAVILLVALVVIGPRDLPRVARTMGKWVAKGRSMAREFQTAIEDMAREAELDKVKSEIEKVGRTNLGKSIENTIDPTGELGKAFDPTAKSGAKSKPAETVKPAPTAAVEAKPADPKPTADPTAVASPAPTAAVEAQPADPQPVDAKSADAKSADAKSADVKSANGKAAAPEPGTAAAGNGTGTKLSERETLPVDPH